jgi:hypothetical protein
VPLSVSRCVLAVAALLIVGCDSDDVTGIPSICGVSNPVRRITLTPEVDTIFSRDPIRATDRVQLEAAAFNREDQLRSDIEFQFESWDTTVVVVDDLGSVQAVGPGTAVITASACGEEARATITVTPAIGTITVTPNTLTAVAGDTIPVTAVAVNQRGEVMDGVEFSFSASDPSAVRIEQTSDATADFGSLAFTSVTAGGRHACALAGTRAFCWGNDSLGQLGDARRINSTTPIPIVRGQSPVSISFSQLSAGYQHTCGVASSGTAFCWGDNGEGQVGNGSIGGSFDQPQTVSGGLSFAAVTAGDSSHTCALTSSGLAYCWGGNSHGQLGDGSNQDRAVPTAVSGGRTFTEISAGRHFTCARQADGGVWCWGINSYGQLGNGPFTGPGSASNVPVRVTLTPAIDDPSLPQSGELSFTTVSAGRRHACAIATDGNAYCWGSNVFGSLGNELQAALRGVPARVGTPR